MTFYSFDLCYTELVFAGKARSTSGRGRTLCRRNAGSSDGADGRAGRRHRAAESREPDGMGQMHEQYQIQSSGNRLGRAYTLISKSRIAAALFMLRT